MRQFMIRGLASILLTLVYCLASARGQSPKDAPSKPRYPALAHAVAVLIILIVGPIVAFPSRKETWDQAVEKPRRARKEGKRRHGA